MSQLLSLAGAMNIQLSDSQAATLERYAELLLLWNKKINLTAITNPQEVLVKHLLDCLSMTPYVDSGELLDVGTGAGLPALIVAVARPDVQVVAFDKSVKRISFIRQCILELKLSNLTAMHGRIEDFDQRFEQVTSRAFSSLVDFSHCGSNLKPGGRLLAMKGATPSDEIKLLEPDFKIKVTELKVPKLDAQRCLVELRLR